MVKEDGRWCAEVIIALPPIVEMDSTELQSKISSRLDSLKNRKFTIVEKKKKFKLKLKTKPEKLLKL